MYIYIYKYIYIYIYIIYVYIDKCVIYNKLAKCVQNIISSCHEEICLKRLCLGHPSAISRPKS